MVVQGQMAKAGPSSTSEKRKAGSGKGEGKKKKVFAESLGMDHMVQMSNSIADSYSTKLQERVDKAKEKAKWEKEKRVEKMRGKAGLARELGGEGQVDREALKGKKQPMSKSSIRASLLTKQREKSKLRKGARKAATTHRSTAALASESEQAPKDKEPKKKRVSFA